jgi:CPA2 family monovalent cation:H+ antiporter-2
VVLKTLEARDELSSKAGRVMLAILIAQDLAVIPLVLILPQLAAAAPDFLQVLYAVGRSLVVLVVILVFGTRLFPRLFSYVSTWNSRELFFLATLAVALGTGLLTHSMGLSFAFGAFVAGMLLCDTDFNHQALSDVAGLRDLFGMVFFVSVGMLFNPAFLLTLIPEMLAFTAFVLLWKALVVGCTVHIFGYRDGVAVAAGFGLAQVGEFAFLIANTGSRSGLLSQDSFYLIIAVTVLSMVLTPSFLSMADGIFEWRARRSQERRLKVERRHARSKELEGHVVLVGAGTVGQYVVRVLSALKVPLVVIELDHKVVMDLRDHEISVVFGDASHALILEAAGVARARLVILALTNDNVIPRVVEAVRALNSTSPLVVRVEEIADVERLYQLGIREAVEPQREVGLEMIRQALLALDVPERKIFSILGQLRASLHAAAHDPTSLDVVSVERLGASQVLELEWLDIDERSPLVNVSLAALQLQEEYGVSIVAHMRGDELMPNPHADVRLEEGDVLGIMGTESQLRTFRQELGVH